MAQDVPKYQFDIPAESLSQSLKDFSTASSQQILFSDEVVGKRTAPAVRGTYTRDQALTILLAGSDLRTDTSATGVLMVRPKNVQAAQNEGAAPVDSSANAGMETVLVTAEKREERLQDVPMTLTVVNADNLVQNNQVRLQDFYTNFPGLDIEPSNQSGLRLFVRGLDSAATIDDVPLVNGNNAGGLAIDLDPSALKQIELLRGPQGTLYGANSLGGLLRYVTTDPSTSGTFGRIDAGTSGVDGGAGLGYSVRGSINVPLSRDAAVLLDGFAREEPGYIDNIVLGTTGVNRSDIWGGHFAFIWSPIERLSIKLGAFFQKSTGDSPDDSISGMPPFKQNYVAGAGPYQRTAQLLTGIVDYDFGLFDLRSVSGFNFSGYRDSFDATTEAGGLFAKLAASGIPQTPFSGFGQSGLIQAESAHYSALTQELRLSAKISDFADILIGGFYDYVHSPYQQDLLSSNPVTGVIAGDFSTITQPYATRSYAAFANATAHIDSQLDLQVGLREQWDTTALQNMIYSGPLNYLFGFPYPSFTSQQPTGHTQALTYSVAPSYKLNPDFMIYGRTATGYNPGTPNFASPGIPQASNPDTATDYELGAKGDLFNKLLSVDAAIFYIEHSDIQVGLIQQSTGTSYGGNGGNASSEGFDLSVQVRPTTGLTIEGWGSYDQTSLADDLPTSNPLYAYRGQALPLTPKWSGSIAIDDQFPLVQGIGGFVGGKVTIIGDRLGPYIGSATRALLPEYTKADLYVGARYQSWSARLYANNVSNSLGLINTIPTGSRVNTYYITPLTIGVSISKSF